MSTCPGMLARLQLYDGNSSGTIDQDEIAKHLGAMLNRVGGTPLSASVTYRGKTLAGAKVVLEPEPFEGKAFTGRVYCTPKALWKLTWFLRDFGYDSDLLGHDEVDDKNLVGLRGVVKISHTVLNGTTLLNLDGFAPASQWEELSVVSPARASGPEAA